MDKEDWNDILTIALNNWPNASLGEDNDGQIIIYTNYYAKDGAYEDPDGQ